MAENPAAPVESTQPGDGGAGERRGFLSRLGNLGMLAGLTAAYGTLAAFMGRFLLPARSAAYDWMFVCTLDRLGEGDSLVFRSPGGASINIARQGSSDDDIIALSSTCPHLGCQVHWEGHNDRFFCPCHNGVFDPSGSAVEGPPAEAGQSLPRYALQARDGMLFIELPREEIALGRGSIEEAIDPTRRGLSCPVPPGPGHDPCLFPATTPSTRRS